MRLLVSGAVVCPIYCFGLWMGDLGGDMQRLGPKSVGSICIVIYFERSFLSSGWSNSSRTVW